MRAITIILIILTSCAQKKDIIGVVKDKWHQKETKTVVIKKYPIIGDFRLESVKEESYNIMIKDSTTTYYIETDEITWNMTNVGDTINTK